MENDVFVVNNIKYKKDKMLGEGSHANAWLAKTIFYPHNEITIKIAKPNPIAEQRIKNEIWILGEVNHPGIPKILEFGENKNVWFAMPRLQNVTINIVEKGNVVENDISNLDLQHGYPSVIKKITISQRQKLAMRLLEDIGNVIDYISNTNIIHADISPSNIMESRGSSLNKHYLLTDWGAAMLMHKYPEESFGSLHFMAPERLFNNVDCHSDIYSLGAVAFYVLTGTIPYPGQSAEEYYLNATIYDGVAPNDIDKNIFPALSKLVSSLVRQEPKKRLTAKEMLKKLSKIKNKLN